LEEREAPRRVRGGGHHGGAAQKIRRAAQKEEPACDVTGFTSPAFEGSRSVAKSNKKTTARFWVCAAAS
jgi:hypothetical protein